MSVIMSVVVMLFVLLTQIALSYSYTKVASDYDLYGIKIAMNDRWMVSVDNLNTCWYVVEISVNNSNQCTIDFNETSCDFVYSVVVPVFNMSSFVYNCIDVQGLNVIGVFRGNETCKFDLIDEQFVSNYSAQDNFVIEFDGTDDGVYGFADDFIFYYELDWRFNLTVWENALGISPRAVDIGSSVDLGVIVGYCQLTPAVAQECGFVIRLNGSSSCPVCTNEFSVFSDSRFPYSDPRTNHVVTQSRVYSWETVLSVSIAWHTRRVLIGIQSVNLVLLYPFDDPQQLIGKYDNGIGLGFGKSVAWLDGRGWKAVILANSYSYSTDQWISSSLHLYDIQSDGFSDSIEPILVYPNSAQVLYPWTNPSMLRLVCSVRGDVAILDILGNPSAILSAPAASYPDTNSRSYTSISVPCIRGTHRNYSGIELCYPCPNGTSTSDCSPCTLGDSFCPYGAVQEISYSSFESIEQDQNYPESPENTVFDDLLMQNMFTFNAGSIHCLLVSPLTWVLLVIVLGVIVALAVAIHEICCPGTHNVRDRTKEIFKKMDLIGEGELWIGGLASTAVVVFVVSAYVSSNNFLQQYPIERVTGDAAFMCDPTIHNAQFSTTIQKISNSQSSSNDNQQMFAMLNLQPLTLNIDLVQTAFTCRDTLVAQRLVGTTLTELPIAMCQTSHNNSILSLSIPLPANNIGVQLTLPGLKTVGAIRLGLSGPSAISTDSRFTLLELKFASTFVSHSLDEVLALSTLFSLELTPIVNRTAPLNSNDSSTFSAIWSSSFSVNQDELFAEETRYTFFYRAQTNVSITIQQSIFYVSNVQQPIARKTEIIFHNLLFTIVVLELFSLLFLMIKLLLVPLFDVVLGHLTKRKQVLPIKDDLPMDTTKTTTIRKQRGLFKARRR